jgi:hypothetical protein
VAVAPSLYFNETVPRVPLFTSVICTPSCSSELHFRPLSPRRLHWFSSSPLVLVFPIGSRLPHSSYLSHFVSARFGSALFVAFDSFRLFSSPFASSHLVVFVFIVNFSSSISISPGGAKPGSNHPFWCVSDWVLPEKFYPSGTGGVRSAMGVPLMMYVRFARRHFSCCVGVIVLSLCLVCFFILKTKPSFRIRFGRGPHN